MADIDYHAAQSPFGFREYCTSNKGSILRNNNMGSILRNNNNMGRILRNNNNMGSILRTTTTWAVS